MPSFTLTTTSVAACVASGWDAASVQAAAAIVSALAAAGTGVVSVLLWLSTRRYTQITNKLLDAQRTPYLRLEVEAENSPKEHRLVITAITTNVSPVPAIAYEADWTMFVDGEALPGEGEGSPPHELAPQEVVYHHADVTDADSYGRLMRGDVTMEISLTVNYESLTGKAFTKEMRARFMPKGGQFVHLGGRTTRRQR